MAIDLATLIRTRKILTSMTFRQSISKHLRILSECDLLAQNQEGREIFYELKIDKMKEIDTWLDQFRKIMEESFKQLDEVLYTIKNKEQ